MAETLPCIDDTHIQYQLKRNGIDQLPPLEVVNFLTKKYPNGVTTSELLNELKELFEFDLSESNLKRYIHHVPTSHSFRIGENGKKGSHGLYPPCIIWQLSAIIILVKNGISLGKIADLYSWTNLIEEQTYVFRTRNRSILSEDGKELFNELQELRSRLMIVFLDDLTTELQELAPKKRGRKPGKKK